MQDLKVILIQTVQHWENKAQNLNYYESNFLDKLKPAEADLILLPEMFSTGFSMDAEKLAEPMTGRAVSWMLSWAKKLNTQIGGSLIISENGNYYNRFIIASPNGIESTYNKRHLFRMANEHEHYTPGEERVIHTLKGWRILLQVCYDLRFPVFSRNRTIDGEKEYDAIIYVANWPEKRAFIWKNLIQARAIENQAYSIGLNRVGTDGNDISYSGDSMLVDPWGNILFSAVPGEEKMYSVDLQSKTLDDIKRSFPAYLDADQ